MIRVSRLQRPFTIREVAEMAGWSYERMKAHLLRLNAEVGGMLLTASKPPNRRYTVMLPALRRAAPDMFASIENLETRVEELEESKKCHETRIKLIAQQVAENTRDIVPLKFRQRLSRRVVVKTGAEAVG